jgi:hypothetical protein
LCIIAVLRLQNKDKTPEKARIKRSFNQKNHITTSICLGP